MQRGDFQVPTVRFQRRKQAFSATFHYQLEFEWSPINLPNQPSYLACLRDTLSTCLRKKSNIHMFGSLIHIIHIYDCGFKYFYFHPDPWGDDPIWRAYFSIGLKPPTRQSLYHPCSHRAAYEKLTILFKKLMKVGGIWGSLRWRFFTAVWCFEKMIVFKKIDRLYIIWATYDCLPLNWGLLTLCVFLVWIHVWWHQQKLDKN